MDAPEFRYSCTPPIQRSTLFAIARNFLTAGDILAVVPHGSGHVHDTYRATLSDGTAIILQRINDRVFRDVPRLMENIARVTNHLRAKLGDPSREALRLVPTRSGHSFWRDGNGHAWRAFRFIDGARTYQTCTRPELAREAARVAGRFQNLLADLPAPRLHETIPHFHDTPHRLRLLEKAIDADVAKRGSDTSAEIDFVLARRNLAPVITELLRDGRIPERVTHNDTKLNNVLFDTETDRGLCLVDLDTCMPGSALYDFGDMVRTMTTEAAEDEQDLSKVEMDINRFEALTRGYLETTRSFLTDTERDHLAMAGRLLTFTIGIRFLTDYLSGDVYFKTHRPAQNVDRCRTQFKLVESMERQAKRMQDVVNAHSAG